jgi:hypothetical protein
VILPNVRASLGSQDVHDLLRALAHRTHRNRRYWKRRLGEQGLDAVLDSPDALDAIMEEQRLGATSPMLTFYVMVRHGLLESGLRDPAIADYVASLLIEFGLHGRAYRIARFDDKTYRYLVDVVSDLEEEYSERRQFLLRAHLGNYSLWLSGIFPDYVVARVNRRGAPGFEYYDGLGSTGYRLASESALAGHYDLEKIYREVAGCFRAVRRALNRVSDRFFFPSARSPVDRLLRQVSEDRTLD